jgi:hypothetical protein
MSFEGNNAIALYIVFAGEMPDILLVNESLKMYQFIADLHRRTY